MKYYECGSCAAILRVNKFTLLVEALKLMVLLRQSAFQAVLYFPLICFTVNFFLSS